MVNLVTVVIPFYNNHKTIKRAIDSVLNQTYEHIEIIIVDDCSTQPINIKDVEKVLKNFKPNQFYKVYVGS